MAFFDNFKEKLTETTQTLVDKGYETAEIVKVKAQIMEEQKKLNEWYQLLGKKYVEMHAEDAEEALVSAVQEILTIQAKIDALKNQNEAEKDTPAVCPSCGAKTEEGSKFCNICGAALK